MNASVLLFMGLGASELMFLILVFCATFIWALVDIVRRDFDKDINKVLWILIVLSVPFFGTIAYLLFGRKTARKGDALR